MKSIRIKSTVRVIQNAIKGQLPLNEQLVFTPVAVVNPTVFKLGNPTQFLSVTLENPAAFGTFQNGEEVDIDISRSRKSVKAAKPVKARKQSAPAKAKAAPARTPKPPRTRPVKVSRKSKWH